MLNEIKINRIFSNKDEAKKEINELINSGFDILPCDYPELGLKGIISFKGNEDVKVFTWLIFDKLLKPEYHEVEDLNEII